MSNSSEEILNQYRAEIDAADREIVRLLLRRAQYAIKIGETKRAADAPVYRPDREKNVYRNIQAYAREHYESPPLSDQVLINIYREIMSGTIALEKGPAIAFMGPRASYSHLALRSRFGASLREVASETIADVFRVVEAGREASYGVVPADNTTEGSVGPTLDMLLRFDLKIYAEMYLRIRHNLLAFEVQEPNAIRKLYSNKIAMEQCREWVHSNLGGGKLEIVETSSTAEAARRARENKDGAAIASLIAAQEFELQVVAEGIQDNPNNMTRFFVIGNDECPPTGDDKTSLIFGISGEPGSLYRVLRPFYEASVNLTRIESRASRRSYGDYNFFIDFIGHRKDPGIEKILHELESRSSFLKILGSYPRAEMPGTV